ncbi:MAG: retropepsin-like aspartic protease [Methylococcales bacterium]
MTITIYRLVLVTLAKMALLLQLTDNIERTCNENIMYKHIFFGLLIGVSISSNAWSEALVHKCKNQQGKMVYQKSPCQVSSETMAAWVPEQKSKPPVNQQATSAAGDQQANHVLKLKQGASGHYSTDATINDKPLVFVVDTGASIISLPESIAHDADIYCDVKVGVETANGVTDACTAKIKKLQFGPFLVKDVFALIVPHLVQPLLGMNVLQSFKISQDHGEMHISLQKNTAQQGKP